MILVFVVGFFFMVRPQMKKQKELRNLLDNLSAGDEVITAGGFRARVTRVVDEREAEVEIAPGVKVRVVKSTLSQVLNATPKGAND